MVFGSRVGSKAQERPRREEVREKNLES